MPSIRRVAADPVSRRKSSTRVRQLVQGGQPFAAQRADGLPRVGQPGLGQFGRPFDGGAQAVADLFAAGQLARALELDGQGGQRMGEHVVQLAGDAGPFGERGRGGLRLAGVLELGHEQFGAVLALPAAPDELADHRQQQAQQHGGEERLGRVGLGQAHGHGQRGGDRSRRWRRPGRAAA